MSEIPVLPDMTKVLFMCSSKMRPERLAEMLGSFYDNRSDGTEMVVYVSEDDPRLNDYDAVLKTVPHIIGPRRSMIQVLNYLSCEVHSQMTYYGDLNDDHYILTRNWDQLLVSAAEKAGGWCWVSAWSQTGLPTGCIVTGNIVRALGFYYPPMFTHTHVDNVQVEYRNRGMLVDVPEVMVDHRHMMFNKASADPTYALMCNQTQFDIGQNAFDIWHATQMDNDFAKIEIAKQRGNY